MEKLIVNVNETQKKTLIKLFEMLHIKVEIEEEDPGKPEGNQEKFVSALKSCFGMWKDLNIDNDEYRKQAWGGRGV